MTEQDRYAQVLRTFLYTPHREFQGLHDTLMPGVESAPLFFAHYVSWTKVQGSRIRDQEVVHTAICLVPDQNLRPVYRPIGLALLRDMPLRQMAKTVRFIKGGRYRDFFPKPRNQHWETPELLAFKSEQRRIDAAWDAKQNGLYGLGRNLPQSGISTVIRKLRELEANRNQWNRVVMTNRSSVTYLYATLRIRPGDAYYDYVLFPSVGRKSQLKYKACAADYDASPFAAIATIGRKEVDAESAALLMVQHNIPWQVATSLMGKSAPVMVALIHQMTPQQLIINMASIEQDGLLDNPDTRALIEEKISKAKTDKRVAQAFQRTKGAQAAIKDEGIKELLGEVREEQTQAVAKISRATLLAVDKSGSQTEGIEISRELAPAIHAIIDAPFWAVAFDTGVMEIPLESMKQAEQQFAILYASGGTSIGGPLRVARTKGWAVEQIVLITDQDENASPTFAREYPALAKQLGYEPNVLIVQVGRFPRTTIQDTCEQLGIEYQVLEANRVDQYSVAQVLTMLARPGIFDLVQEIMDTPLLV